MAKCPGASIEQEPLRIKKKKGKNSLASLLSRDAPFILISTILLIKYLKFIKKSYKEKCEYIYYKAKYFINSQSCKQYLEGS